MSKKEQEVNLVIYTDGGCKPNPGTGGLGAFGYIYNSISKQPHIKYGHYITERGILTKEQYNNDKVPCVIPINYIVYSSYRGYTTNNECEVNALINALTKLLENTKYIFKEIKIITDSEYLLHIIDNIDITTSGKTKTIEHKLNLNNIIQKYKDKYDNIKVIREHVYSHKDNLGNNIADMICNMSIDMCISKRTSDNDFFYMIDNFFDVEPIIPDLNFNQISFCLDDSDIIMKDGNKYRCYPILNYSKDIELGKRTTECLNGLLVVNHNDNNNLNRIKDFYISSNHNTINYNKNFIIDVNVINDTLISRFFSLYKFLSFTLPSYSKVGNVRSYFNNRFFLHEINSSPLGIRSIFKTYDLKNLVYLYAFSNVVSEHHGCNVHKKHLINCSDITNLVYDLPKYKLKLRLSDKDIKLNNILDSFNINKPIYLTLGYDIPNRTFLNSVSKYKPNIKLLSIKNENIINNYTIISTEKDNIYIIIVCNLYSNKILV